MLGFFTGKGPRRQFVRDRDIDLSPPGKDGNVIFRDTHFVDCRFERTGPWPFALTDCVFERCRFRMTRSYAKHFWTDSRFIDCDFVLRSASALWFQAGEKFRNCRFEGTLKGGRFDAQGRAGMIDGLDLSALKVDLVEFRDGAWNDTVLLPPWPAMLVTAVLKAGDPRLDSLPRRIAELATLTRPGEVVLYDLARMKAGEEERWEALKRADWVRHAPAP